MVQPSISLHAPAKVFIITATDMDYICLRSKRASDYHLKFKYLSFTYISCTYAYTHTTHYTYLLISHPLAG